MLRPIPGKPLPSGRSATPGTENPDRLVVHSPSPHFSPSSFESLQSILKLTLIHLHLPPPRSQQPHQSSPPNRTTKLHHPSHLPSLTFFPSPRHLLSLHLSFTFRSQLQLAISPLLIPVLPLDRRIYLTPIHLRLSIRDHQFMVLRPIPSGHWFLHPHQTRRLVVANPG